MRAEESSKSTSLDTYNKPRISKLSKVESKPNKTAVIIRKRHGDTTKTNEPVVKQAKDDAKK